MMRTDYIINAIGLGILMAIIAFIIGLTVPSFSHLSLEYRAAVAAVFGIGAVLYSYFFYRPIEHPKIEANKGGIKINNRFFPENGGPIYVYIFKKAYTFAGVPVEGLYVKVVQAFEETAEANEIANDPNLRQKNYLGPLTDLNAQRIFFLADAEEIKRFIETAQKHGYGIKLGIGKPPFDIKESDGFPIMVIHTIERTIFGV